jgi:hypothetical protein
MVTLIIARRVHYSDKIWLECDQYWKELWAYKLVLDNPKLYKEYSFLGQICCDYFTKLHLIWILTLSTILVGLLVILISKFNELDHLWDAWSKRGSPQLRYWMPWKFQIDFENELYSEIFSASLNEGNGCWRKMLRQ